MQGIEIDLVIEDSVRAFGLYETVFGAEKVEVTAYRRGLNEAIFTLHGTRFHLLDANPEYGLTAPGPEGPHTMWFNLVVPDIAAQFAKAIAHGFTVVQEVTNLPEMGVRNAILMDPFSYMWMLHQIDREVSFEERTKIMDEVFKDGG